MQRWPVPIKDHGSFGRHADRKLPDTSKAPDESDQTEADNGDQMWVSFRFQTELPEERYVETKAALKELVDLRNELVHHFLQRFDLWDAAGCKAAEAFLMKATKPSTATT